MADLDSELSNIGTSLLIVAVEVPCIYLLAGLVLNQTGRNRRTAALNEKVVGD
jgi:ABC-type amino acid transport system permease subunit